MKYLGGEPVISLGDEPERYRGVEPPDFGGETELKTKVNIDWR